MAKIIPAVLEKNFDGLEKKLSLLSGFTDSVQIDICDGVFTPESTWPYISIPTEGKALNYDKYFQSMVAQASEMPYWQGFDFEIDLMISDAKRLLPDLMNIGPSRVVFHFEAFQDFADEIYDLKKIVPSIVEVGVAFNPETDVSKIYPLIDVKMVTFVQCMGISKIGFQGSHFDEEVFEKTISNIKLLREKYPDLPISVDGGVSLATAKKFVDAGASRLISGSAVFAGDMVEKNIAQLNAVIQ